MIKEVNMQRSLSPNNWNIWDALIVFATVILSREISKLILDSLSANLSVGPTILLEYLGSTLGLFLIHSYMQHRYYRSKLKINMNMEKPWWYLQIALISGVIMFVVLTVGYAFLLRAIGVGPVPYYKSFYVATSLFDRATLFVGLCLFFPLITEIVYRGYLYQAMEDRWSNGAAMLFSSLLFSLYYLNFWLVPPMFLAGIVLVLVYEMTSSLYTSIFSMMIWQVFTIAYIYII
jgi:membrane protease YdiL (CAAX protease family)